MKIGAKAFKRFTNSRYLSSGKWAVELDGQKLDLTATSIPYLIEEVGVGLKQIDQVFLCFFLGLTLGRGSSFRGKGNPTVTFGF